MKKNKSLFHIPLTFLVVTALITVLGSSSAEAKKKKNKEKNQEAVEQPVIIDVLPEEDTADSVVYFDEDSMFFVDPDPQDIRLSALETILPHYTEWKTAQLNGSIRMKGLPISPSVRIYMEKGNRISVSVRASLLGEVGRIEVSGDTIMAVNKMKRTYCVQTFGNIRYDYPDIISDVQSLLLDRVVIPQSGELNTINADFVDFSLGSDREISWIIDFPKGRTDSDTMGSSYGINADGLISKMIGFMITSTHEFIITLDYSYPSTGYNVSATFIKDEKPRFNTSISFDAVQWNVKAPAPIEINSRYTKLAINDFIKSFKF